MVGKALGGWSFSGNYILASGQRYTPLQAFSAFSTASGNPYDIGFLGAFVGFDTARPFLGSMTAPDQAVGIFAGDACALFDANGRWRLRCSGHSVVEPDCHGPELR